MDENHERMLQLLVLALKRGLALLCIFDTVLFVKIQFDKYSQDLDETQVEYKSFNTRVDDPYPSIALCLTMAIHEERLKKFGENLTAQDYARFLEGSNGDENMLKVEYENVTTQWTDYILMYGYTRSDPRKAYVDKILYASKELDPTSPELIMHGFREFGAFGANCFTLDFPFERDLSLSKFWLLLKPEVFVGGVRPSFSAVNPLFENQFIVYLHYPKQFVRHFVKDLPSMGMWPNRGKHSPKSYRMRFNIKGMEVLEKRNKRNKPCTTGLPDFDDLFIQEVFTKLECKPPYWASWKSSTPLPTCRDVNKMEEAAKLVNNLTYSYEIQEDIMSSVPCRGLERINYDHSDDTFSDAELSRAPILNDTLGLYFYFKESTYKELKHVKSIDEQSLIGNYNKAKKCLNISCKE